MLVMRLVCDVITNVMQQRGGREQQSLMTREIFSRRERVENSFSKPGDLVRVCLFISEASSNCMHAAQLLIGNVRHRRTRLRLPVAQAIDNHSLAQTPLTSRQRFDPECTHRFFEYQSTGDDDLSALRREPSSVFAFLNRHCCD